MNITVAGRRVAIYTGGVPPDAHQRALVFLHGAGLEHSVWALQSRYFAHHGYSVYVPDLPAHGHSEGPALTSVEALALWTGELMRVLGLASVGLIGHSMGSLVALEAAALNPDRVTALALLGSACPMLVSEKLLRAAREDPNAAFELINVWAHRDPWGANPTPGLWQWGMNFRLLQRSVPGVLYSDLLACRDYAAGLVSARQVTCPSLLILGASDQMTPPRGARELEAVLPHVRSILIRECGHSMMSEQPDQVVAALRGFLPA
jgi:pimeloyl-ACP methyl ester carboxylesterase